LSYSAAYLLESVLPIGNNNNNNNHNSNTITTTNQSSSSSTSSAIDDGRYSDNFRNGGRRVRDSTNNNNNNNGDDEYIGYFEVDEIQQLRALLLSIPSTRQRMRVVLEKFHQWRLHQERDEFA